MKGTVTCFLVVPYTHELWRHFTSSSDPNTGSKRVIDLSTFGNTWPFPKGSIQLTRPLFDHSLFPAPLALLYHIRYCCWNTMMHMLAFIVRWPHFKLPLRVNSMQNYYATLSRCPMSRPVSKVDA